MNTSQKKYLRGLAHKLDPVVFIGKELLSESVVEEIDNSLSNHELIKVKFNKGKEQKENIVEEIEKMTNSISVGIVGNTAIFYRMNPDESKQKIKI